MNFFGRDRRAAVEFSELSGGAASRLQGLAFPTTWLTSPTC